MAFFYFHFFSGSYIDCKKIQHLYADFVDLNAHAFFFLFNYDFGEKFSFETNSFFPSLIVLSSSTETNAGAISKASYTVLCRLIGASFSSAHAYCQL